jgi:negative regulator of flagellin synthesis FlgM
MRIDGQETPNTTRRPENTVRSNEASRTKATEDIDHSNEVAASDKVELSPQARDIQRAREVAQGAPEVRADKVEAARRALQSGKLNLKGQDLAEKLLQDTLPSREQ